MQLRFSKWLILLAFLPLAADARLEWPDREAQPRRLVDVEYRPLALGTAIAPGVRLTGAWEVRAEDARVAGLSALAATGGGRLQALSDSGVLVDLSDPSAARRVALVHDLPDGPGPPTFRRYRDAEAMLIDEDGSGRWIAFENRHSLWRFERDGGAFAYRLPSRSWRVNKGVEAMVEEPGTRDLLLLLESGTELWRFDGPTGRRVALAGAEGEVANAARLPDGRIVVAVRGRAVTGIVNRLAWLERAGDGYRLRSFAVLPLGPFDNVEGLAPEVLPDGGTRLWAVTDNDGWRRTLLLRMEVAAVAPAQAGASGD